MQVHGSCHCGDIRYEADVAPEQTAICHCTDCQKLTGSAYRVSVPAREGSFRLIAGEPRIYVKTADNAPGGPRPFARDAARRSTPTRPMIPGFTA
jgi:hypothetical protein